MSTHLFRAILRNSITAKAFQLSQLAIPSFQQVSNDQVIHFPAPPDIKFYQSRSLFCNRAQCVLANALTAVNIENLQGWSGMFEETVERGGFEKMASGYIETRQMIGTREGLEKG